MLDLVLNASKQRALRILCVGAHCDDIEIGCGATLRVLQNRAPKPTIDWVVLSGTAERRLETQRALKMLVPPACRGELRFGDFADGRFPALYGEIKKFCEALKDGPNPDLIFCHERDDRHQDHRIINEMIWNTFRDHVILEYEIPKWDGGLGQPNVYVPLDAKAVDAKLHALMKSYRSQANRDWFTRDTFVATLRLRGLECRSPTGYAEAFYGRKLRFSVG